MLIRLSGIRVALGEGEALLADRLAAVLAVPREAVRSLRIVRKSLDARRRRPPCFVYTLEADLPEDIDLSDRLDGKIQLLVMPGGGPSSGDAPEKRQTGALRPLPGIMPPERVVVLGAGPAGLFAALHLVERGIPVLMLERGKPVPGRCRDVRDFWERGQLRQESNVVFGEGGAGTFSDGKLTSRVRSPHIRRVKEILVAAGAPPAVLVEAKPHVGTDRLRSLVANLRQRLGESGCEIRFGALVTDLTIRDGLLRGIVVNGEEDIPVDRLVLAMGQHASDTYRMLRRRGVGLARKPFALGVRVEHPQELINEIQYGRWKGHPALPPAEYVLAAAAVRSGRSVYTFCMCPGGQVIGCSSEPGGVVTNGMSSSARDGLYANSAVVVNVTPGDIPGDAEDPLSGLAFRRCWEERAFSLGGGGYTAPAQGLKDFLEDRESHSLPGTSFLPRVAPVPLKEILPRFVSGALQEGFRRFERNMPGFITGQAVLIGVESRTSSPVRILRDAGGRSVNVAGLYPCGEGAGYAGGIVSSALDGIRAAEAVLGSLGGRR